MANVTYKHLEGRTALGPFALAQWVQLLTGVIAGLVFAIYLSPLPVTATIFVSCLLPGLPLAASYGAMGLEFSVTDGARAAWRYWRRPHRYLSGAGGSATGYRVEHAPQIEQVDADTGGDALEGLWDA